MSLQGTSSRSLIARKERRQGSVATDEVRGGDLEHALVNNDWTPGHISPMLVEET